MRSLPPLAVLIGSTIVAACSPAAPPAASPAAATAPAADERPGVVGRAPAGAVVTLAPAAPGDAALPPGPAILDQYARNFVPDLLLVRVGQRVEFRNSEDIDHNVAVVRTPTGTRIFDTSTPPFQKYEHTFDRAGRYDVSCDVHPGMRATIVATEAPYAAVVDGSGSFAFDNLEPGRYTLTVSTGARSADRAIEVANARVDVGSVTP